MDIADHNAGKKGGLKVECICGYISDRKSLENSASGGLASALAHDVLRNGGVVYGVVYKENFRGAEYKRFDKEEQMSGFSGSKYLKASLKCKDGESIYAKVERDLRKHLKVLFVGLPCEVAALKKVLYKKQIDVSGLFTVDLICHGPTVNGVAEQFLDDLEKKYKAKVISVTMRYKNPNWTPPYFRIEFDNQKVFLQEFYETNYGIAFQLMPLASCYQCRFKGEQHSSDVTIGDYWGIKKGDPGYNEKGVSIAFCHNSNAKEYISNLNNFCTFEADIEKALSENPMYSSNPEKTKERICFEKNYMEYGLNRACWMRLPLKSKIKQMIISQIQRVRRFK